MVGNLADTPFDGQSAILQRGLRGSRGCHYAGDARFVPGDDDPANRAYAGTSRSTSRWRRGSCPTARSRPARRRRRAAQRPLRPDRARRRPPVPRRPRPPRLHHGRPMTGPAAGTSRAAKRSSAPPPRRWRRRAPPRRRASAPPPRRRVDVIVVGAGSPDCPPLPDLVHAGHSVAVLEARDRVGGRTLTTRSATARSWRWGSVGRPGAGPAQGAGQGTGNPHVQDLYQGRPGLRLPRAADPLHRAHPTPAAGRRRRLPRCSRRSSN